MSLHIIYDVMSFARPSPVLVLQMLVLQMTNTGGKGLGRSVPNITDDHMKLC